VIPNDLEDTFRIGSEAIKVEKNTDESEIVIFKNDSRRLLNYYDIHQSANYPLVNYYYVKLNIQLK